MFIFAKENQKYPIVATEDAKHFILVGCSDDQINEFAKERDLIIEDKAIYKVYETTNDTYFTRACASFPRNLNPILQPGMHPHAQFVSMHKYFYINNKREMFVEGTYLHKKDETSSPFMKHNGNTENGFRCLAEVKLVA